MKNYKTAGKQRLLTFLQAHPDQQFTVDEIGTEMTESAAGATGTAPGHSSLYRQLSALCADGTVRKFRAEGQNAFVYQFVGKTDCCHHFHLKCLSCGCLIHLTCGMSDDLLAHIRADHGFQVDSGRSILYGLCATCSSAEEGGHSAV